MCVFFLSKTNIKLDSIRLKKLRETSRDGFVPNLLYELGLCHQMW